MGTQHIIFGSYIMHYLSTQSTTIRTSTMHGVNILYTDLSYKVAHNYPARSQQYYVSRPYGPITRHLQVLSTSYLSHPAPILYTYIFIMIAHILIWNISFLTESPGISLVYEQQYEVTLLITALIATINSLLYYCTILTPNSTDLIYL